MAAIITVLRVPKSGGIGTVKVILVRWLVRAGDCVKRGDPVVELETEKVNYELDSPIEGTVVKILARETEEVPVGDPLCEIDSQTNNSAVDPPKGTSAT